jgi:phage baseplate assembly protein W
MNNYYKIPLQLGMVMEGNELPACSLSQSIAKKLELIIMTRFGEHRGDPSFGCEIWDLDFELIVSASAWEEKLRHSLLRSVTAHEHRLLHTTIMVSITDMEKFNTLKNSTEIKKKVNIHIAGTIGKTGEPFSFSTSMFLSPLSLD